MREGHTHYALCDFVDADGVQIRAGQELGVLRKMGRTKAGQAWNTIKGGRVTAVILGNFSNRVGLRRD